MNTLELIGRNRGLFSADINTYASELDNLVSSSRILVVGGAGSIGKAVCLEIFKRNPKALHVVDLSENNLVELVRTIRSTLGYSSGEFKTFAIDCGSPEYEFLIKSQSPYDYIFNLSALKHVRSEKDPYTLMRMIRVNIFNTIKTIQLSKTKGLKNYFAVSTDKAANPANMMGASKRIMEKFMMRESASQKITNARFANVAFSDGSLLHGFNQRFLSGQPLSAPRDIKRYFVTAQESGELCLLSGLLAENREIFYPKQLNELELTSFADIAVRFLEFKGYEPYICASENEARTLASQLIENHKWPCYFFDSNTSGEKDFEEFYLQGDIIDETRFNAVGIIKNDLTFDAESLENFTSNINRLLADGDWSRIDLINLFRDLVPEFSHKETGFFLDDKM